MSTPPTPRSRGKIRLDSDQVRIASGGTAPTEPEAPATPAPQPQAPASQTTPPRSRRNASAEQKPAAAPAVADEPNPDAREGEAYPGEEMVKIGTALPVSLKGQMDGLIRFAQDTGAIDDVATGVDVFRIALSRYIVQAQKEFNNGEPFHAPRFNRRGRPAR